MDLVTAGLIGFFSCIILGLLAFCVYKAIKIIDALEKRVSKLEHDSKQDIHHRLTHGTLAAHEDALAVLMRLDLETSEFHSYLKARHQQLARILQKSREGPYSYDPEGTTYDSPTLKNGNKGRKQ